MNINEIKSELDKKVNSLIEENKKLLNQGDKIQYQNNCNVLHGIAITRRIVGI